MVENEKQIYFLPSDRENDSELKASILERFAKVAKSRHWSMVEGGLFAPERSIRLGFTNGEPFVVSRSGPILYRNWVNEANLGNPLPSEVLFVQAGCDPQNRRLPDILKLAALFVRKGYLGMLELSKSCPEDRQHVASVTFTLPHPDWVPTLPNQERRPRISVTWNPKKKDGKRDAVPIILACENGLRELR